MGAESLGAFPIASALIVVPIKVKDMTIIFGPRLCWTIIIERSESNHSDKLNCYAYQYTYVSLHNWAFCDLDASLHDIVLNLASASLM